MAVSVVGLSRAATAILNIGRHLIERLEENLTMQRYLHEVRYDVTQKQIVIDRVFENGARVLFTVVPLATDANTSRPFSEVAIHLGEALLFDLADARDQLGLSD